MVTRHGKPVAAFVPIDQEAPGAWVPANTPEYGASLAQADEEFVRGERGTPLDTPPAALDKKVGDT